MTTCATALGPSWLMETKTRQVEAAPSDSSHAAPTRPCRAIAPVPVAGADDGRAAIEGGRPRLDEGLLRGPQAARVTGHGLIEAGGTGLRARGGGGAGADPAGLPGRQHAR